MGGSPAVYKQEGLFKQRQSEQKKDGKPQGNQHSQITSSQAMVGTWNFSKDIKKYIRVRKIDVSMSNTIMDC